MSNWKRILTPLASLRITVTLLILSMLLVYAGTLAQRQQGVWQVQDQYFHSLICWIPLQNLFFRPFTVMGKPLVMPMAGGYLIGLFLLINLLAAHILRFKFSVKDWLLLPALAAIFVVGRLAQNLDVYITVGLMLLAGVPFFILLPIFHKKRTGVILIHLGLILLLIGEAISSNMKIESQMAIAEGHGSNWSQDIRDPELAVTDASKADHDDVTIIPAARLLEAEKHHQTITDHQLPFDVQVDAYYDNSGMLGPFQAQSRPDLLRADTGSLKDLVMEQQPEIAGASANDGKADMPAAYVTLFSHGNRLGRFVLPTLLDQPQTVKVDGKAYQIALRFHRYYNPYTIYLEKFNLIRYPNSDTVKDYSSVVRLVDPAHQEDREIRIWMNHPLRYNGKTIYQAGFDPRTEKGTILQVVTNPGWQMPYVACAIGAIGLVTHFLMKLLGFLRQQSKLSSKTVATPPPGRDDKRKPQKGRQGVMPVTPALSMDRYSGSIKVMIVLPICVMLGCLAMVMVQLMPKEQSGNAMDLNALGALPVLQDGRVQPFDSAARNALKIISGKESFTENAKTVSATQWLLNLQSNPRNAAQQKVIRIDLKDISGLLSANLATKMFSLDDILDHWPKLGDQIAALSDDSGKEMTLFDHKLTELRTQLQVYFQAGGESALPFLLNYPMFPVDSAELSKMLELPANQHLASWADLEKHRAVFPLIKAVHDQVEARGQADLTTDQKAILRLNKSTEAILSLAVASGPMLIAPLQPGQQWMTMRQAIDAENHSNQENDAVSFVTDIRQQYVADNPGKFNQAVAAYHARLASALPKETSKAEFEARFNQIDPFTICIVFYILCFVLIALSWLKLSPTWTSTVYWSAVCVAGLTLVIHTVGLISRIYISGAPPVTNLASSAIFIAWGIVVMALGFEYFYRNGIGLVAASIAGVASLLIADGLSADGDTFKVLQAVLATNFWLATHVVCVTLGYASTFLTGLLGIIYVIRSATRTLTKESSRELARMIYGVACFAILFSFVGTVLGGIWADQSWGRFWGWDPKENGAVLVVLSNALLLHARWGGLVKARGIANFAIFGCIITAWSWFGTNMLGIGLHAYGFMEKAPMYLISFVIAMLALIVINLIIPNPAEGPSSKLSGLPSAP